MTLHINKCHVCALGTLIDFGENPNTLLRCCVVMCFCDSNMLKWQCLFRHRQNHPVDCIRHYVITVVVTLDCFVPPGNVILTGGTSVCIAHCADMTRAALGMRLSECQV
jgi:hypothetical protein